MGLYLLQQSKQLSVITLLTVCQWEKKGRFHLLFGGKDCGFCNSFGLWWVFFPLFATFFENGALGAVFWKMVPFWYHFAIRELFVFLFSKTSTPIERLEIQSQSPGQKITFWIISLTPQTMTVEFKATNNPPLTKNFAFCLKLIILEDCSRAYPSNIYCGVPGPPCLS